MLQQLLIPYKLKEVNRSNRVQTRAESDAEHIFSCLIILEHISSDMSLADKEKVRDLLLYHDFEEILAGDVSANSPLREAQQIKEDEAFLELINLVDKSIQEKYRQCHDEFAAQKTKNSRLAKAIDKIDPMIQALTTPGLVKKFKFTEEFYNRKNAPLMKEFPKLELLFNEVLAIMKATGEFS